MILKYLLAAVQMWNVPWMVACPSMNLTRYLLLCHISWHKWRRCMLRVTLRNDVLFVLVLVGLLHGDMNQVERNEIISAFKNKAMPVLVATDVAGTRQVVYSKLTDKN